MGLEVCMDRMLIENMEGAVMSFRVVIQMMRWGFQSRIGVVDNGFA